MKRKKAAQRHGQREYALRKRQPKRRKKHHPKYTLIFSLIAVTMVLVLFVFLRIPRADKETVVVSSADCPAESSTAETSAPTEAPSTQTSEPTQAPTEAPSMGMMQLRPESFAENQRVAHLRFSGDILVTDDQLAYALKAGNGSEYRFEDSFAYIGNSLSTADFTMCNLETTVGRYKDRAYSGYPDFNAPTSLLEAITSSGYDMLSLANNHMLDRWGDGLLNTVNNVEAAGLAHVGGYRSAEERSTPVVVKVNGIRIGFVAYTRYANRKDQQSDPEIVAYGVPFFYNADIEGDIRALREAGAEVVVAYAHWGAEYTHTPSDKQRAYANSLIAAGADIIIGGHPHMLQPMETVTTQDKEGNTRSAFVVWSIGDFLSSYTARYTNAGIILDLMLSERIDGSFDIVNIGYVPTFSWVHDNKVQVLPIGRYLKDRPQGMSDKSYEAMKQAFSDTTKLIGSQYNILDA